MREARAQPLSSVKGFQASIGQPDMAAHNVPPVHKGCFKGNALKITPGARRVPFLDAAEKTPTPPPWKMAPGAWRE